MIPISNTWTFWSRVANEGMIKVKYTGDRDASGKPTRAIGPEDRQDYQLGT